MPAPHAQTQYIGTGVSCLRRRLRHCSQGRGGGRPLPKADTAASTTSRNNCVCSGTIPNRAQCLLSTLARPRSSLLRLARLLGDCPQPKNRSIAALSKHGNRLSISSGYSIGNRPPVGHGRPAVPSRLANLLRGGHGTRHQCWPLSMPDAAPLSE